MLTVVRWETAGESVLILLGYPCCIHIRNLRIFGFLVREKWKSDKIFELYFLSVDAEHDMIQAFFAGCFIV